jgi:hypothetical protein
MYVSCTITEGKFEIIAEYILPFKTIFTARAVGTSFFHELPDYFLEM